LRGIRFLFELRPIEAVEPWGAVGDRSLHWFGLTDGWQCLDTTAGRLLEYAAPARPSGATWMEYQVVRLFEDLLSAWPFIAESVPDDVASRFFGWYSHAEHARVAREEDDATQKAWDEACFWWYERNVQFNHLRWAPELYLWRAGSEVNLVWDAPGENEAGPVWSVQHARLALPLEDVREALGSFCRDFLEAMARRVAGIERGGWKRIDCWGGRPRGVSCQGLVVSIRT